MLNGSSIVMVVLVAYGLLAAGCVSTSRDKQHVTELETVIFSGDGLWVWGNIDVLNDREQQDALLTFIAENNIAEVYLAVGMGKRDEALSEWKGVGGADVFPQWQKLIKRLHRAGVQVEALCGDTDWLMPENGWDTEANQFSVHRADRANALQIVRAVCNYNRSIQDPEARFDGLQLDVEINWFDDGKVFTPEGRRMTPAIQTEYFLELMDQVTAERTVAGLSKQDLHISWVIYADKDDAKFCGVDVAWPKEGGVVKPGWQHALDRMEKVIFMTYFEHDRADQMRPVVDEMQTELDYLDGMESAPPVWYAFEFQHRFRQHDLLRISLWNEDRLTLLNQKMGYSSLFINRPYFKGFAMHCYDNLNVSCGDYRSWLQLQPNFEYPTQMKAQKSGNVVRIPVAHGTEMHDPLHVRLRIKADPVFAFMDSQDHRNMISIIPVGLGYVGEDDLVALGAKYDGIAPTDWNFYSSLRWWPYSLEPLSRDLQNNGVCWPNPASIASPDLAVERDMLLQPGEIYRFIVAYNDEKGIGEAFYSFAVRVPSSVPGWGDSADTPARIDVFLGKTLDSDKPQASHTIESFVIVHNQGDLI